MGWPPVDTVAHQRPGPRRTRPARDPPILGSAKQSSGSSLPEPPAPLPEPPAPRQTWTPAKLSHPLASRAGTGLTIAARSECGLLPMARPARGIPRGLASWLALQSSTWQWLVRQWLRHRHAGSGPARRRFGVLRPGRRPATAHTVPAETEEDGRCQRRQHDRDQQDRAHPGARRVCRPSTAGRPPFPPWPRQPLVPAPKRQRPRVECLQPGHVLVPGQLGEYREHRRQVRLAGMQRMCHAAENPLLAGGQAHPPAPIRCPASRGGQASHAVDSQVRVRAGSGSSR
jgi:hypothetical protein